MSLLFRGVLWFGLYMAVVLAPLAVALVAGPSRPIAGWWAATAAGLGLAAFAVIVIEFALVSRLRSASEPFGTDALMQFHRLMGIGALLAVVAHALYYTIADGSLALLNPAASPAASGAAALWLLLTLVVASVFRRRLRIGYEAWQSTHSLGALLVVAASGHHALDLGSHAAAPAVRALLLAYPLALALLMLRYRLLRPLRLRHQPWEVAANHDEGASTRRLVLRPVGHGGFDFMPGQFAWISTARSPLAISQHPLSLCSSAVRAPGGEVEFSIKGLGDWSGLRVPALRTGDRVWIDGPYGSFTCDREPGLGFVMISGGSGIAPMRSMLLTLRDRGDPRPVLLIHAARGPGRMAHRQELLRLQGEMNLEFVPVYEQPPVDWPGESGLVTYELLQRRLPERRNDYQYFVCGPGAMMDSVETSLMELGIQAERIHTERFDMV